MSVLEKAAWGSAGAAVWLLLVYALPSCLRVAQGRAKISVTAVQALGAFGAVTIILLLGASAPFFMGAHAGKEALGYGLGWQGIFGEFARKGGLRT